MRSPRPRPAASPTIITVILLSGTMQLPRIVEMQAGGFWHWNIIRGGQIVSFIIFLIAAFAETNRVPFDLPEAENELVAGFHTEYSSMKFASFFMAEYANIVNITCVGTVLFLGGWHPLFPAPYSNWVAPLVFLFAAAMLFFQGMQPARKNDRITFPIFGVIFLGQPREATLVKAHDAGVLERIGLAWLALGCITLGLIPTQVVGALRTVVRQLAHVDLPNPTAPWWLLEPLPGRLASYSGLAFLLAMSAVVFLTILGVRLFYHRRVRRAAPAFLSGNPQNQPAHCHAAAAKSISCRSQHTVRLQDQEADPRGDQGANAASGQVDWRRDGVG